MKMKKDDTLHAFGRTSNAGKLHIEGLCKSYGTEVVLSSLDLSLEFGKAYCLMAPSGSGKTTLFRILMELEQADAGQIYWGDAAGSGQGHDGQTSHVLRGLTSMQIAAVFQEDRLLEGYTALENLRFVTGRRYTNEELTMYLQRLLPDDALPKPVHEFSGGMKRRTAILRALLAPSDFLIMDEPFTGLDADTKQDVIDLIRELTAGKLLLISTHNQEDAALLGAEIISLSR